MLNVDRQEGVTVVELDHGPVNAFDLELSEGLIEVFDRLVGPVVVIGKGRAFSAGVDLAQVVEGGEHYVERFLRALSRCFLAVFQHPAPTVAALNGHAVAGGCVLALACDVRFMAAGRIGLSEVAVGVSFPPAALEIARHRLGTAVSSAVLRADLVEAIEARRVGLVDEIVDEERLREEAVACAARLGSHPGQAYADAKRDLQRPVLEAIERGKEEDVIAMWNAAETQGRLRDQLEALRRRS